MPLPFLFLRTQWPAGGRDLPAADASGNAGGAVDGAMIPSSGRLPFLRPDLAGDNAGATVNPAGNAFASGIPVNYGLPAVGGIGQQAPGSGDVSAYVGNDRSASIDPSLAIIGGQQQPAYSSGADYSASNADNGDANEPRSGIQPAFFPALIPLIPPALEGAGALGSWAAGALGLGLGVGAGIMLSKPKPKNVPTGTRPIDKWGIGTKDIHDIKKGVDAGNTDWVGVTPDGDVITAGPDQEAVNKGHVDDFTRRPITKFPRPQ